MEQPPTKLAKSLIEVCVVISMDQDTGLVPAHHQVKAQKSILEDTSFEAPVIAVLSGQVASFPYCEDAVTGGDFYPPEGVSAGKGGGSSPVKLRRSVSVRPGVNVELPVSSEVINTLGSLCLPDGGHVFLAKPPDSVHFLVLTDIEGVRSYACVLTLYKPFHVKENPDIPGHFDLWNLTEQESSDGSWDSREVCFTPMCCCLISKLPYLLVLKDCLSSLLPVLRKDNPEEMRNGLMKFTSQLAMVPVPPAGILNIEFELNGVKHVVQPPDEPERRVVDLELHLPFLCLSVEDVLFLIECILVQQRIIFLSSNYSLLTSVIESLFTFIQPFSWSWTYVPILPSSLIDLIEAPGAFIMGCHISHLNKIVQVMNTEESDGLVMVDLEKRKVTYPKNMNVPKLPETAQEKFRQRFYQANPFYDFTLSGSPSLFNVEEGRKQRESFMKEFHRQVLAGSLEMMVEMFSDIKVHIVQDETRVYFNRDGFIDSKPEHDRDFYATVCKSHGFSEFLYKIVENPNKRDYFDIMTERSQPKSAMVRKRSTIYRDSSSSTLSIVPESNWSTRAVFKLPPFTQEGLHTGRYYAACIQSLTEQMNNKSMMIKSVGFGASLHFLRGVFHAANRQPFQALEDFQALSAKSVQIFPTNLVHEIVLSMSDSQRQQLKDKDYFKKADFWKGTPSKSGSQSRSERTLLLTGIPERPLDLTDFVKHVKVVQVTTSDVAANALFNVLANAGKKRGSSSFYANTVCPEEFQIFYESLNQTDHEAQAVVLQDMKLDKEEFIVKVSHLIKTDLGMGRLLLTTDRLLFLADGTHHCTPVARLWDIADIQKYQHYIVLPPGVPALKIINKDRTQSPFGASLKENRNDWFTFIKEMVAGHELAEDLKDDQIIKQAAQNVIVADALLRSEGTESMALSVCYLSKKRTRGQKKLGKVTSQALIRRVNPSDKDSEMTTVEALTYVPKGSNNGAQLWCGMASGSVVVIDIATWTIESQLRCAKSRVSCMLAVGTRHVWAGSFDTTIYVIDTETRTADQQLQGHSDFLAEMIISKNQPWTVFSASLNGQIIEWDAETLTRKREVLLDGVKTLVSILLVGDNLWCATRYAVYVVDKHSEGEMTRFLSVPDEDSAPLFINCLVKVSDDEVWGGCGKKGGKLAVWNTKTFEYIQIDFPTNGFTKMVTVGNKVWAGSRKGDIYILDIPSNKLEKELVCHTDSVRSFCVTDCGHVISGPGSLDGRVAVWRSELYSEDSPFEMGFEVVESEIIKNKEK